MEFSKTYFVDHFYFRCMMVAEALGLQRSGNDSNSENGKRTVN